MAEQAKSKRDAFLSGRYPDRQFANDDEIFDQVGQDFEALENEKNTLAQREQDFSNFLSADPRNSGLFMRIKRGEDPILWLVRQYGPDIAERAEDPEFQKQLEDARKDYLEQLKESEKLNKEYDDNIEATGANIDAFAAEVGDEAKDAVMNALSGIVHDYICGKVTPETLKMVANGLNYETDIANASKDGEIRGRNSKIDEKLKKGAKGDGTVPLGGTDATAGGTKRKRSNPIFDIAEQAK
ncbi:MAG: hypothetical protein IJK44_05405 [Bacteroidales bacterium]|nr:hypothetical protein [Bacteroidales bacterium]